jgi:hypothetical protein
MADSTMSEREALEAEIMRQYEANPQWDEAKDVIEGLDCEAILAALTVSQTKCSNCGGRGYVAGDPEGAPIEDCPKCRGSGRDRRGDTHTPASIRAAALEEAAKVAEADMTPGYGPHRDDMEFLAERQRSDIAARIRALGEK